MHYPRILITPGEPAGIGPDIVVKIAQQAWSSAELLVVGDPDLLLQRAKQLNLPLQLKEHDPLKPPIPQAAGVLSIIPIHLKVSVTPGLLNAAHAPYIIDTLAHAATLCMERKAAALVTGPVHKASMNQAGIHFTGHTEWLASFAQVKQTVMLFVTREAASPSSLLKVALATTHLPLADVAKAITQKHLESTLSILHAGLKQHFGIEQPRVLVCGLNPHAGEGGYLGQEEIIAITPVIRRLREKGYCLSGPLPADTVFTPKYLAEADAILAMYHDQALPLVKYIGFGRAVNMTLGLPFIRTSVDHGTALDIAGKQEADAGSMIAAIELAIISLKPPSSID